ncbi:MAG: helix-turn-helix domain-containing protein [Flavobacteriaceae bacterium]|nr:helix-turn-helix domain-containing protein [Flavobacteriaceae bacterium]
MINNLEFAERLKKVMDHYQLSAASFADTINVQRSSISHLLSGRNKPSLDFVLKVLDKYKDVELYWLLNGKGSFPKRPTTDPLPPVEQQTIIKPTSGAGQPISTKKIDKIIIFYNDGTFQHYHS